jgi:4-diphosphocytidyl-2-C-methyl-D-erythritol kinase
VLRALDALSATPVGPDRLMRVGATLGADVAFLASPYATALGRGRGDELTAVAGPSTAPIVLVVPPFGVATAEAYAALAAARGAAPARAARTFTADAFATWDRVAALAENDFEPVVFDRHPGLAAVRRALVGSVALLSGSGSALFAVSASAPAVPAGWGVVPTAGPVAAAAVVAG